MLFCTLYPEGVPIDLVKDVGQIPINLSRYYMDIHSRLVSCHISKEDYNDINIRFDIVKICSILNNPFITGVIYILCHAKEINWLNVYHCGRKTYIWCWLFKMLNPRGKIYLKLDLDFISCNMYDNNKYESEIFKRGTEKADIVSAESQAVVDRVQKHTDKNIIIIPNGFCLPQIDNKKTIKKKIILTVGRLGTEQKATDILLDAFAKHAKEHEWSLRLIGNIEKSFIHIKEQFYGLHPELRERVVFTGEILDRGQLNDEYRSAAIFVLPSRWESFGIAAIEAIANGCKVILSDQCPVAEEVTNNQKYGKIVASNKVDELADAILEEINECCNADYMENDIIEYAFEKFSWKNICRNLYDIGINPVTEEN